MDHRFSAATDVRTERKSRCNRTKNDSQIRVVCKNFTDDFGSSDTTLRTYAHWFEERQNVQYNLQLDFVTMLSCGRCVEAVMAAAKEQDKRKATMKRNQRSFSGGTSVFSPFARVPTGVDSWFVGDRGGRQQRWYYAEPVPFPYHIVVAEEDQSAN